jgi:aspartyl aminopeptidase
MLERDELFFTKKNALDTLAEDEKAQIEIYSAGYKQYLDKAKTEREAVREAILLASPCGFVPYERGMALTPGLKIYKNVRDKALILAVIGRQPLSKGTVIAGAHTDSPRIDLKQLPLFEDSEMAYFKTHYYGGIKKYQWMTIPLALHGVAVKKDGTSVDIVIGENEGDPIFVITDLLPHLAKDQEKKTLGEAFTGENLNILIGSRPTGGEKDADRVKHAVLQILFEKYGIVEEDFLSAELEAVPAAKARDVGFDRSLIGAYGQDDRSCVYAELKAILDIETPEKTAICILTDKEEVGSDGVSGSQSAAFELFMEDLCDTQKVKLRHCFENSFCLSADVCNAYDPNFPEVSEKRNAAKCNYGLAIMKHSGARGKSGSSEASAETVAKLRKVFADGGVVWQTAELGKVDQGGGGTIAKYMANRDIDTIDAGVPVLSMHAPYEVTAKLDCYMTYKGIKAIYSEQ